jgi:hypothetical protein
MVNEIFFCCHSDAALSLYKLTFVEVGNGHRVADEYIF